MKALEKQKTIYIAGGSVLIARNVIIENKNGGAKIEAEFLIAADDYMRKVDFQTFKKAMLKYESVCINSWNAQLRNDYMELVNIVKQYESD